MMRALSQLRQCDIITDGAPQCQSFCLSILRDKADVQGNRFLRFIDIQGLSINFDLSAPLLLSAKNHFQQFCAPRTNHAGKSDNLSFPQAKRDIMNISVFLCQPGNRQDFPLSVKVPPGILMMFYLFTHHPFH